MNKQAPEIATVAVAIMDNLYYKVGIVCPRNLNSHLIIGVRPTKPYIYIYIYLESVSPGESLKYVYMATPLSALKKQKQTKNGTFTRNKNVTIGLKIGMHTQLDSGSNMGWVPPGHTSSGLVVRPTNPYILNQCHQGNILRMFIRSHPFLCSCQAERLYLDKTSSWNNKPKTWNVYTT